MTSVHPALMPRAHNQSQIFTHSWTLPRMTPDSPIIAFTPNAGRPLVPPRRDRPELLDQGIGTLDDVRENLREMWRLNAIFGGVRSITRQVFPILAKIDGPIRVIDLGTGSGGLAITIARWARNNSRASTVYAIDVAARHLTMARENIRREGFKNIETIHADAFDLPFAPGSVDVIVSSLFMHHFTPDGLARVLSAADRVASRAVVMGDITRGSLPRFGFTAIAPVLARHRLTREDGRTSIERAYLPDELRQIARAADLPNARVIADFPWRAVVVSEKSHV